jgi:hypothetical protein
MFDHRRSVRLRFLRHDLTPETWALARERADAMPIYANSHREREANLVGAIGEVVFERWLRAFEIPFERTGTTRDDYRVGPAGLLVEVKTKDRTVRPRGDYAVSVPAYNADHQAPNWYVFSSLLRPKREPLGFRSAFLLGGAETGWYREHAELKRAGDTDPNGTTFWTDCWNLRVDALMPMEWLADGFNRLRP